jgi:DNA-binding MarR family transcriptional regulator
MHDSHTVDGPTPVNTVSYLVSKVGQESTSRFGDLLEPLGIRPRHCGMLAAIAAAPSLSQAGLAGVLSLVPSAIVTMVDELEAVGAVRRVSDPADRRRYAIELTDTGLTLLTRSAELAQQLDAQLLAGLTPEERSQLADLLAHIHAGA